MADSPITGLPELFITALNDVLAIDDVDVLVTKKIQIQNLLLYPGPIGTGTPNVAEFTQLTLVNAVNEFSTDGTFSAATDDQLATALAVKTYVDAQIATTDEHDELLGLQGGDATAVEFYHLTKDVHDGLYSGSPLIGIGDQTGTNLEVDYGTNQIFGRIGSTEILKIESDGITNSKHMAIGADATVDLGAAPGIGVLLVTREDSAVHDSFVGQYIVLQNEKSDAAAVVVGEYIFLINSTSTLHDEIIGANVYAASSNNSGATVNLIEGMTAKAGLTGDNSTIGEMIGGEFGITSGFSMANSQITTAKAGQFQLLVSGSGDLSITDGYGIIVKTPSFNPTGTTTNLYGLYIEDQSTVGFTNHYNLLSAGVGSQNKFEGNVEVDGDAFIHGSVFIDGTTFVVNTQIMTVEDPIITVNKGEMGAGVTGGMAGLRVDRGSLTDYHIIFDESDDYFKVGLVGSEQRVALYQELLTSVPHNQTTGLQGGDSTADEYYHLTEDIYDGLFSGSPIIGIGNPARTNLQIDRGTGDLIFEGDLGSGIQAIMQYDESSAWWRIGNQNHTYIYLREMDDAGDGSIRLFAGDDIQLRPTNELTVEVNSVEVINVNDTLQVFGVSGDMRIEIDQGSDSVNIQSPPANPAGRLEILGSGLGQATLGDDSLGVNYFRAGYNGSNSYVLMRNGGDWIRFETGGGSEMVFGGVTITEFSTDGTMVGDSDNALPTEKAVKTYVDAQIATTDEHNELLGLQGGDSTSEFYHLTKDVHDGLYSGSPIIGLGNQTGTHLDVDYGSDTIKLFYNGTTFSDQRILIENGRTVVGAWDDAFISAQDSAQRVSAVVNLETRLLIDENEQHLGDGGSTHVQVHSGDDWIELTAGGGSTLRVEQFYQRLGRTDWSYVELTSSLTPASNKFEVSINQTSELLLNQNGLKLKTGATVNEISGDISLSSDSTSALVTENAVKTYVDTEINKIASLETINGWEWAIQGDSTATVIFDIPQVDTLYSVVGNLVNEIDAQPSIYGHIIKEKTTTGFVVLFSGSMDSGNYYFDWILSRNELTSSSSSSSSSSAAIPAGARFTDDDEVRHTDDDEIRIID